MRVLSVSVELHSNFFRGSDILIVFLRVMSCMLISAEMCRVVHEL